MTPLLRKYKYQVACRSPQATKSAKDQGQDDVEDGPMQYQAQEVKRPAVFSQWSMVKESGLILLWDI